ncbi:hypothetical protein C0J52_05329 [Blattella germanica]|nr:hypothetical protein C0J52_05329 [Blattella germanica]
MMVTPHASKRYSISTLIHGLAGSSHQGYATVPFGSRKSDICPHILFIVSIVSICDVFIV